MKAFIVGPWLVWARPRPTAIAGTVIGAVWPAALLLALRRVEGPR